MTIDTAKASEELLTALQTDLSANISDTLTRMNTLSLVTQRLWWRVVNSPENLDSYKLTVDEITLIRETALAYKSGDTTGK